MSAPPAKTLVLAVAATVATAAPAVGQPAQAPPLPSGDQWVITVAPYLWATSMDGHATVGGTKADVDVPFKDVLKDLSFGAMMLVDVEKALRRRHQRPVRTGLVGHRCGPDRDRHNQRHRAARDRAVLSGGRLGVSHVVFRPAASASGRARGRVSLDLHAHRTRGSRRPRRGSERDLSTR
jgi:hypothetical protein